MTASTLVLDEAASVVLDASGNGTVRLGPSSTRASWHVLLAVVRVSTNVLEPVANLYQNSKATSLGGTYTGSNDQTALDIWVRNGYIIAEWIGGDPGARATLFLNGTVDIGG